MGFMEGQVLASIKYPIHVAATPVDHPQCPRSYCRRESCCLGCPLAWHVHWFAWKSVFALLFRKKRETEVIAVQTLGVVSIYIVLSQLVMAEAMPLSYFSVTSLVVPIGLVFNFLNYSNLLTFGIWRFWEDFITVGGLSTFPQVMWSTFVPYITNTILPVALAFLLAMAVIMARMRKLLEKGIKFVESIFGWTTTLLFIWMPISQMWTNFLNPDNIKGLSALFMLLKMIGNGLMIPCAIFIHDFMCSLWASFFYGYGNIVCLYWFKSISREFCRAATTSLFL